MNIALQRNQDFIRAWSIVDQDGAPVSIDQCTLAMQVKDRLNTAVTIASAEIEITDATRGEFQTILRGSEGSPLSAYGDPLLTYNLPYDLRLSYADDLREVLVTGVVILSRGKTFS